MGIIGILTYPKTDLFQGHNIKTVSHSIDIFEGMASRKIVEFVVMHNLDIYFVWMLWIWINGYIGPSILNDLACGSDLLDA